MSETNGKAGQIFALIPRLMAEVGAIEKSRRNQQQNYAFRGIDDIYAAVQSHFAAAGVFVIPEVLKHEREERHTQKGGVLIYTILTVKHTFYAPDASSVAAVTVGEAMDSGDKSCNKAMSAAMKYALIEALCIPTAEPKDTENDTHAPAPRRQQQPQQPRDPLSDPEDFRRELHRAFLARKFGKEDEQKAVRAVMTGCGVERLAELNIEQRRELLSEVREGKADIYKAEKVGAA